MENTNVKREYEHYLIIDEVLIYKLADAGLLDKMHKVLPSRHIEGARAWLFDETPPLKICPYDLPANLKTCFNRGLYIWKPPTI